MQFPKAVVGKGIQEAHKELLAETCHLAHQKASHQYVVR